MIQKPETIILVWVKIITLHLNIYFNNKEKYHVRFHQ